MRIMPQLILAAITSLTTTAALADDPAHGTLVMMPVKQLFVPVGFDDNDEVQVVVDGYLPDTCHRVAFVQSEVRPGNIVKVRMWARRYTGICLPVVLPFSSEARIGQLPQGAYKVQAAGVEEESLNI